MNRSTRIFRRIVTPLVDDLQERGKRFLPPARLEQGLAFAVVGLIRLGRVGKPLALAAAAQAQQHHGGQEAQQMAQMERRRQHDGK